MIGAAAALRRRWTPSAVLLLVAAITAGPYLLAPLRARTRPIDRPALRVASVNLAEENLEDPTMEDALRSLDADVLVLPECTHPWQERLEAWFVDD